MLHSFIIIIIIGIYYGTAQPVLSSALQYNNAIVHSGNYSLSYRATKQISFQVATESSVCVNVPDVGWKYRVLMIGDGGRCIGCTSRSSTRRSVENVEQHQKGKLFVLYAFRNREPV